MSARRTVLLLLSDKRSGSTMLQDALCSHPAIGRVNYTPHTYFETQHWLEAAVMLERPAALFAQGTRHANYGSARNARAYMVDTLKGNLPGFVPAKDDRALVFEGWEALCARFANPVFFEKSPQYLAHWAALSLLLEWMQQTEFAVKIVFLVRNPLAVQHSAGELFGTPPELRQFAWLNAQRNLLALRSMLPADDSLTLRYEDLLANPGNELAGVFAFAGLPDHPGAGAGIHARSEHRWRDDPAFTLALDPAVRQVAAAFGYREEELDNPNGIPRSPGAARLAELQYRRAASRLLNGVFRPALMRLRGR